MKKISCWLIPTLLVVAAWATQALAAPAPKEVVVYSSVDDVFARPIAAQFEKKTGIRVKLVPDTEETKSTGLLNRLIAEKGRPQADVFWSGDPVRAAILKAKQVSSPYRSPEARELPKLYSDSENHWTGFSARARVILYNRDKVPAGQEPKSIMDLADPKWKGQGCMANPLFGTTSMHAAAIFEAMGNEKGREFFDSLKNNRVKILSSNGEVRRQVSSGQCSFGLTDTDDAAEAVRDGKPVGVIFPDEMGLGTLIVPNTVVLIAGAPHFEAGKQFIDFLLSPETEEALAKSDAAQMPVRPGVSVPSSVKALSSLTPMKVNYSKLASRLDELSRGYLKEWANQ
jgi:iron(III) transport system substrate-binding protein